MAAKMEGSTCIWQYNGREWPVILCDDHTPPKLFMDGRRLGSGELPAVLLGKRKYIWVADDDRLQEIEPHRDYLDGYPPFKDSEPTSRDDPMTKEEKLRHMAFKQDVQEWQTLEYWKNFIESRKAAREVEREINAKGSRKRKHRHNDDDDIQVVSVRRSTTGTSSDSRLNEHNNGSATRTAKGGQQPTPGPTPVKGIGADAKLPIPVEDDDSGVGSDEESIFVSQTKAQSDPFTSKEDGKLQKLRERHEQSVFNDPPSDDTCTVFVGDAKTPFRVPTDAVGKCDFLSDQVQFSERLKTYIDLSESSDVTAQEFIYIAQYLQEGDFSPRYIDGSRTSDSIPRIDGWIMYDQKQKDTIAERCALVFRTASQLQFAQLQSLVVNKLQAMYPLSPLVILIVTRIVRASDPCDCDKLDKAAMAHRAQTGEPCQGCEARAEMFSWLVAHIAEYFYRLMKEHGGQLAEILRSSQDLNRQVLERALESPGACDKGMESD